LPNCWQLIADAHPELKPNYPRPARMSDDWLWEDATEFCAALERYDGRITQAKPDMTSHDCKSLKRQDNVLIVIESGEAAAAFKRTFDARFSGGETWSFGAK
jgi:hypothetical protein